MVQLSSLDIVANTFKCLFVFYATYYLTCSACAGAYPLKPFNPRMPFDFEEWADLSQCCMSYNNTQIAHLISLGVTYVVCTGVFLFIVPGRLWDYAITLTVLHVLLSSLVMLSLPKNWSWWVCLGFGLLFMVSVGEATLFFVRTLKQRRQVEPEPRGFCGPGKIS